MKAAIASLRSIANIAKKEFLHIVRDWRILVLILTLPPAFTVLLGHAIEETAITDAPAILNDADNSPQSRQLVERLRENKTFAWRNGSGSTAQSADLLKEGAQAVVTIPPRWGESLCRSPRCQGQRERGRAGECPSWVSSPRRSSCDRW